MVKNSGVDYKARYCMVNEPMVMDMGLTPGGRMKQDIYDDPYNLYDWDTTNTSRCFIHIANSMVWRSITGEQPPYPPVTAREYTDAGLPWFDWYDDKNSILPGSNVLNNIKSVVEKGKEKGDVPLPENQSVMPDNIIRLHATLSPDQVREW